MHEAIGRLTASGQHKIEIGDLACRLDARGHWCMVRAGDWRVRRLLDGALLTADARLPVDSHTWTGVQQRVQDLLGAMLRAEGSHSLPAANLTALRLAARMSAADYRRLADDYRQVYPEPVPILPPDRYADLLVQPALGCPNATCRFCGFYRGRAFRRRSRDQWLAHLDGVERLLGPPGPRSGIFLGSANALALPQAQMLDRLDSLNRRWGRPARGMAAFFDPEHAPRRSIRDWRDLHDAGLGQLVIGLETGWGALRRRLGKSGDFGRLRRALSDCREAGIGIGLSLLAGIGRGGVGARHCSESIALLRQLNPGAGDRIYVALHTARDQQAWARNQAEQLQAALRASLHCRVLPYLARRFAHTS